MRIGILGGTFSPPHLGHLILAQEALKKAKLEKIVFIPCGNPPHKNAEEVLAAKHRFEMVRLAIAQNSKFDISDIEIVSAEPSYTAKTLEKLKKIYPDDELCFIVGADSLCEIDNWYSPQDVFDRAEIIAAYRGGEDEDRFNIAIKHCIDKYNARITKIEMKIDISSSNIRECIKKGETVENMLTKEVITYIRENGLYKENA